MITTAFIKIWNQTIGAVAWNENTGISSVEYDPKIVDACLNLFSEKGNFIATTTLSVVNKIAVKFVISNLGTKTAEGWSFNMVLPTTSS